MASQVNFTEMIDFTIEMKEKAYVTVTKVEKIGFNDMEGNQYLIGFKMTAIKGTFTHNNRKSTLFQSVTNSSYIEDYMQEYDDYSLNDIKKELQEYLDCVCS